MEQYNYYVVYQYGTVDGKIVTGSSCLNSSHLLDTFDNITSTRVKLAMDNNVDSDSLVITNFVRLLDSY